MIHFGLRHMVLNRFPKERVDTRIASIFENFYNNLNYKIVTRVSIFILILMPGAFYKIRYTWLWPFVILGSELQLEWAS